jgi:hypothetical protein
MIELPSVTNSVELEGGACSEDITVEPRLNPLAPVSVTEQEDGLVCNIDGRASILGCITVQALSVPGNGIANPESTPAGVGELLSEGGQSVTAPNLFTPLAGQNLEAVFREAEGSRHELELSAPLSVEAVQTPQVTSSDQEQNPTENDDNIDPMETFFNSITTPLEQPLLPNPEPILYPDQGEADEEFVTDQNQRKSTRLANKAKSRVGKNATELAQELLAKKLGELTPQKTSLTVSDPDNFENFSQHLAQPLNKVEMEAILDLAEHGTKLSKKAGRNKAVAQMTEEA